MLQSKAPVSNLDFIHNAFGWFHICLVRIKMVSGFLQKATGIGSRTYSESLENVAGISSLACHSS